MQPFSISLTSLLLLSIVITPVLTFKPKPATAQTAGCGSGASVYLLKILSPVGSRQFRVACNEHDTCYDTFGKSQQECDKAFHNRMLGICASDHNTILGRPLRIACNGRADAYYAGVRDNGADAYRKAQASAKAGDGLYKIGNNPPIYYLYGNGRLACWIRTPQGVEQRGGWGRVRVVSTSLSDLIRGREYSDRC
jgi:hypothetical protein